MVLAKKGDENMSDNLTFPQVVDIIKTELDTTVLLDTIFEKKLYHEDALRNEHLINGEVEFSFNVKENYTNFICPFHDTDNEMSAYSYHKLNAFECQVGDCYTEMKRLNPIDLYMVLVLNVDPKVVHDGGEDFTQSVKDLAKMLGITWSYEGRKLSDEELKEIRKQRIRQEVCEIYHREFLKNNDWAKQAREFFFYERGFGHLGMSVRSLLREQKIGFAGGKYGSKYIYNIMKKRGYTDEELLNSGVVQYKKNKKSERKEKGEYTTEIIDFLTRRLTIPYKKGNGKINNGYGREIPWKRKQEVTHIDELTNEQSNKKKTNSKHMRFKGKVEQPINFDEAKKYEKIIIVEGEIDWLTFKALGYNNVIAVGGTNGLGRDDIMKMIEARNKSGKCSTIYFCLDEDAPGQSAMMTLGSELVSYDFDVRVVRLVDGDPNDYLKNHGKNAKKVLEGLIQEALTFEAFAVLHLIKKAELKSSADRRSILKKVKSHIKNINNDELIYIVDDIIDILNENTSKNKRVERDWLLHAWDVISLPKPPEMIGFERSIKSPWLLVTDKIERYEAILGNDEAEVKNVVFVPNIYDFTNKIQNIEHINSISFDTELDDEAKKILIRELDGFKFLEFVAPSIEEIKTASKYEIISMFKKVNSPNKKTS